MEINRKEILRYLGYKGQEADEKVEDLVETCIGELLKAAVPRHIARCYPLSLPVYGEIDFTCFQAHSEHLWKNLADCSQIILFAATLGTEVDVLIRKYNKLQMSKAVILQAASAAMIEEYCDEINEELRAQYESQDLYLRPRFSPGYGDFPLQCQKPLTEALETRKRIGITLTDSLLMAPSKSVTAVIGVSSKPHRCEIKGCELCGKTECAYRRG